MSTEHTEAVMRETLRAKAAEAADTLTFDDVRRDAAARRRHATRRTVLLAAAAVLVVVGAPTAFLLRPDDGTPSPAPAPTPTATTGPTRAVGFDGIRRGADPQVAFVHGDRVHEPDGTTLRLPADDVVAFTPYHGGWLTMDSVGTLSEWDASGSTVFGAQGETSSLAVSADRMRTAYKIDDEIRVGITTGMGEGETSYSVGTSRLTGFVDGGIVFTGGDLGKVGYLDDQGRRHFVPGLSEADATAAGSDLIGGLAPDGVSGRVVTLAGDVLWTSAWQPRAFSPDGRFVAAVLVTPDGEGTDLGILDGRTGSVYCRESLRDRGLQQFGAPVWEESGDAVLLQVQDATGTAVVRLDPQAKLTLASDVESSANQPMWVFATQP